VVGQGKPTTEGDLMTPYTIRAATGGVASLTQGPALLAERDGTPVAAISLTTGNVVAVPGERAAGAPALLRRLRYRLLRQGGNVAQASTLLRRVATA
jgi:ABC-type phosphonate transport system ATPase subunit